MRAFVVSIVFFLLLVAGLPVFAAQTLALDNNDDGVPDQWYEIEKGKIRVIRTDRNHDGTVDAIAWFNKKEQKEREALDFNYDGRMDDFYYYDEKGVLLREEIDSNFDDAVDIWVYLYRGIYVRKWEQDTDFDGIKDRVVDYDKE